MGKEWGGGGAGGLSKLHSSLVLVGMLFVCACRQVKGSNDCALQPVFVLKEMHWGGEGCFSALLLLLVFCLVQVLILHCLFIIWWVCGVI